MVIHKQGIIRRYKRMAKPVRILTMASDHRPSTSTTTERALAV